MEKTENHLPDPQIVLSAIAKTFLPGMPQADPCERHFCTPSLHESALALPLFSLLRNSDRLAPHLNLPGLVQQLESSAANRDTAGICKAFSAMSLGERTRTLQAWRDHPSENMRLGFQALKRSLLYSAYAHVDDSGQNSFWADLAYHPVAQPTDESDLSKLRWANPKKLEAHYDAVIVGSGAGGSVAAYELSRAGWRVMLLEQGEATPRSEMGNSEWAGNRNMMSKSLGPLTPEKSPILLSGRGLGGGTMVNWMTCLEPSPAVLDRWGKNHGLAFCSKGELIEHCRGILDRIGASPFPDLMNTQNRLLQKGCVALDWAYQHIPRNATGCHTCDLCQFGCPQGRKQDARTTFLQDACDLGAVVMTTAKVRHITEKNGEKTRVTFDHRTDSGEVQQRTCEASIVVIAAGAIESPSILYRSGLRNPHLGHHLQLHPSSIVFGRYPSTVKPWQGPPQSVVCNEFANSHSGHGFRLETVPLHPGFTAMAIGWENAEQHQTQMMSLNHLAGWLVLLEDLDSGHLSWSSGQPEVHYEISKRDGERLKEGIARAWECHQAAGAESVFASLTGTRSTPLEPATRTKIRSQVQSLELSEIQLYSAHQMSTCRMSTNHRRGVADPSGKVFETQSIFVADSSLLPSAPGVNPMITVMGMARHVGKQLAETKKPTP